jgi:hypothetical protein
VSFRENITGYINNLLEDEDKACAQTQNLILFLAGALSSYKEEGVEFSPSVILCDDVSALTNTFPGGITYIVGEADLDPATGPRILKDCAPLSSKNWHIFIQRQLPDKLTYGVFTYFHTPTAIPLHEGISINSTTFCVLLRKIGGSTVELRGSKGNIITLIFSTIREVHATTAPMEKFAAACCSGIENEDAKEDLRIYLVRLFEDSLTSSHGTILLCGDNLDLTSIPEMKDAVSVSPTLDFNDSLKEYQTLDSAGAVLNLQRCEELFRGFLRCDGMVVFDTLARVTAYRVFFRPNKDEVEPSPIVGGARRRAFEGLKPLVGKHLLSALFRSQDGLTLEHGVT